MGSPVTEENVGGAGLEAEIKEQDEVFRNELAAIVQTCELVPPVRPVSRAVTPELTPDSMASRIPGFLGAVSPGVVPEELSFDRMGSRIIPV